MEVPSEGNEAVQAGERVDEGLVSSPEEARAGGIPGEPQETREAGTSSEVERLDPVTGAPSEVRPSLDEVWESIKSKDGSQAQEDREPQGPPQPAPDVKERPRPSSLRTRPSTRAKRNVTFKDDVVEEEKVHRPGVKGQAGDRPPRLPPACLGLFLAVALASLIVYLASPKIPSKPQLWTSEELGKYNGTDNKPPLLLGILGSVFDVSKGWQHYGPGGSYHHFVGRDASRAFVSGNFTGDGLTDSLEGLTPSQIKAIDDWRLFFLGRYVYLGKLVGTFYNKEGLPTKKLHLAEKEVKKAAKVEKQQKLDEERFPNCNSRWTQDEGGEVWCDDGKYPRIAELVPEGPKRGAPRTRCACLAPDELQRSGLRGYDGCDALSSRCKT